MIPEAAVEAAWEQARADSDGYPYPEREEIRRILEAAAPHMLAHEREETRLAHVDAVVNAETVDRLEAQVDRARELHPRTCDISGPNCEALRDPSMKCTMMVCGPCGESWPCPTIAALD